MITVKKYSNRRLYDTDLSRYVTLEELATRIQAGVDVQVVDAKSGEDLTQATLTQIIVENRGLGRLLPVSLLTQLIRLGDDALGEFLGRYVTWALELYQQVRKGAETVSPFNPLATMPLAAAGTLMRMFSGAVPWESRSAAPRAGSSTEDELAALRRELEELKAAMRGAASKTE